MNQEPTGCWTGELAFDYDYDDRGLVTQRTVTTDEGESVTDYEHDALGRLDPVRHGDYMATYGWDAASNLVAESVSDDVDTNFADDGWVIDRDVNAVNQVTQVVTDVRLPEVHTTTESLTYDARGNRTGSVTTRTTGDKTHDLARVEYTFDGMDQLVGVHDFGDNLKNTKDDQVTGWSRDGLGRGLTVTENGTAKLRVFDGTALIVDGDTRVTYGPDGRVLSEAFETVVGHGKHATEITVTRDVLTDLLGSAVGIAEDGIVNADLTWFGDFGDTLSAPAWDTVASFTGHVETAGLVEFATRTYDPATRLWVQEDSFTGTVTRASSLNRYAYVEGSPVSHTDVLGAFRAAAAMAAQQLSAVDYAEFMQWFAILAVIGVHNEQAANTFLVSEGGGHFSGNADLAPRPNAVPPVVDPWQPFRDDLQRRFDPDGPLGVVFDAALATFWKIAESLTEYPSLPSLRRFILRGVPVIGAVIAGGLSFSDGLDDDRYASLPLSSRVFVLAHRSAIVSLASFGGEAAGAAGGTIIGGVFGRPVVGAVVGEVVVGNVAADAAESAYDWVFDRAVDVSQVLAEEATELGWSNDLPFVGCLDFPKMPGIPGGCTVG